LTLALSQDAHEGRRWSHLFLRSRQRLQALTLRKDEAAEAVAEAEAAGAVGDVGFADATDDAEGEGRSASWEESSKERLRLLIRAHGRIARFQARRRLLRCGVVSPQAGARSDRFPAPHLGWNSSQRQRGGRVRRLRVRANRSLCGVLLPCPKKHLADALPWDGLASSRLRLSLIREIARCFTPGQVWVESAHVTAMWVWDSSPRGSSSMSMSTTPQHLKFDPVSRRLCPLRLVAAGGTQ